MMYDICVTYYTWNSKHWRLGPRLNWRSPNQQHNINILSFYIGFITLQLYIRSSSLEVPSTTSVLLPSHSLDSSTTAHLDTTFTTGLMERFQARMLSQYLPRLPLISSSGVPSSWVFSLPTLVLSTVIPWLPLETKLRMIFWLHAKDLGRFGQWYVVAIDSPFSWMYKNAIFSKLIA